ncbi:MAG: hypothetical protein H6709_19120 [Kofleriaceae bacterium]|nr:hypothetical protein [Myxococcales bacterium]MCB9561372.1 hypothetical protein [Kofleriaceae bacterium]MCB9574202.1 hypothetical protein [Kofleriaceae bacterium]
MTAPSPTGTIDLPVKIGVAVGGVALVALLTTLRFCGTPPLPPKSSPPRYTASPEAVVKKVNALTDAYMQGVERDALKANLPAPTLADMGKMITFHEDATRRTLSVGDPPVDVAGLRISAVAYRTAGSENLLGLRVENPGAVPLAYRVDTQLGGSTALCQGRTQTAHNGIVVAPGQAEVRSECTYRRGVDLYVTRVESAELTPIQAYLVSRVSTLALGGDERVSRGHHPELPPGIAVCNIVMSQSVQRAFEDGDTRWRDLVDFYARHPCDSYQFPQGYKAFTTDGEQNLPVVGD